MKCETCGGSTRARKVTKQHRLRGKLYVVENVPAQVCSSCGERYYHAKTLDAIDALLTGSHRVRKRIEVEVVRL